MTTPKKRTRIPVNKRKLNGNQTCEFCDKTPSEVNCINCIMHMLVKYTKALVNNNKLTLTQKIAEMQRLLEGYKQIPVLYLRVIDIIKEQLKRFEIELAEQEVLEKLNEGEQSGLDGNNQDKKIIKIPIAGKKSEVGYKLGLFFFNQDNKDGFNIPKKYQAEFTEIIASYFVSDDDKPFRHRTILDNILIGANEEIDNDRKS